MALVRIPEEQRTISDTAELVAYLAERGIEYERAESDVPLAKDAPAEDVLAGYKRKIDELRQVAFTVPLAPGIRTVDWEGAQPTDVTPAQLLKEAPVVAPFLPLPPGAMQLKTFTRWAKNLDRWLARTQRYEPPVGAVAAAPNTAGTAGETPEVLSLAPKRGGVSVEIVAIAWELG